MVTYPESPDTATRETRVFALWTAASIAVGLWMFWPVLDVGFISDDYVEAAMIDGAFAAQRGPLDLFSFAKGRPEDVHALQRYGSMPWWAVDNLNLSMLRPLASALVHFDRAVFGRHVRGYHAHSFFWWAALMASVALLLRTILPQRLAAAAVFLFALNSGHHYTVTWLANRSAFVSLCFGLLGLHAHIRWRRSRSARALASCIGFFCVSLLSGEWAFPVLGYVLAYEWLGRSGPLRERALALLPASVPALIFLIVRGALGFGAKNSGIYVDPLGEPARFGVALLQRIPIFLGDMFFSIPAHWWDFGSPWRSDILSWNLIEPELWLQLPEWHFWQVLLGVIAGVLALAAARWALVESSAEERHTLRWLCTGAALALLPMPASFPSTRLTLATAVGVAVLFAVILRRALHVLSREPIARPRWVTALVLGYGILLFQIWEPLTKDFRGMSIHFRSVTEWVLRADVEDRKLPEQRVLLLSSSEFTSTFFFPYVLHYFGRPMPRSSYPLCAARHATDVVRVSDTAIEVQVLGGTFLRSDAERLFRSSRRPLRIGERVQLEGMSVQVQALQDGLPQTVRFEFDENLDSDRYVFLAATDRGLKRVTLPSVGERVRLKKPVIPNWAAVQRAVYERRMGSEPDFVAFDPVPNFVVYDPAEPGG